MALIYDAYTGERVHEEEMLLRVRLREEKARQKEASALHESAMESVRRCQRQAEEAAVLCEEWRRWDFRRRHSS